MKKKITRIVLITALVLSAAQLTACSSDISAVTESTAAAESNRQISETEPVSHESPAAETLPDSSRDSAPGETAIIKESKSDDSPVSETDISVSSLSAAAIGSPDDDIKLAFASERPFNEAEFPDLLTKSNLSSQTINGIVKTADALNDGSNYAGATDHFFNYTFAQYLVPDDITGERIIGAYISTGDPLSDDFMRSAGYENYDIDYCYPSVPSASAAEEYCSPVWADLKIDGKNYKYYFHDNQFVRRYAPEGISDNPSVSDFVNGVYKLGCYLGSIINKERNVYDLLITSTDAYEDLGDRIVIRCPLSFRNKSVALYVDDKTVFSEDCDLVPFDGYQDGDTPLTWYRRKLEDTYNDDSNLASMPLIGSFPVKATGGHVDELLGCYWWD